MKRKFHIPPCPPNAGPPLFGADKPWLAPLAGYSDLPFRMLCREYGAAVCVTEMVSARGLLYENPATGDLLASIPADQPLVVQLFGAEPEIMAEAVTRLKKAGYSYFDCNFGCPVRKVMRQKAGAALLDEPGAALAIARAMLKAAKKDSPQNMVGFKLRTGVVAGRPVLPDLALRLEDAGADWLALHPRWASQGYAGRADWNVLAKLAPRLSIPLLASGDMESAERGHACIAQTGASGVMYARGALRNPSIFNNHLSLAAGRPPEPFTPGLLRKMMSRHIALSREYDSTGRAFYKIRSLLPRYIRVFPGASDARKDLCACQGWEELASLADNIAARLRDNKAEDL